MPSAVFRFLCGCCTRHEVEAWSAAQAAPCARWLIGQNFKGERHRVVLLPDSAGGIAAAVAGLGKRQGALSLWHSAGLAERLPACRFRFAQNFSPEEATQLCLGFAYGAYRFDRYRTARGEAASIEAPPNADVHFVALAAEALAHGARLDQYAGGRLRSRAARRGRAPARRTPSGRLSGVAGRGPARGEFAGHSRGGTRQQRGAAAGRAALVAARRCAICRASPWWAKAFASTAAAWTSNRVPAWR